jgi:hypothetical protein
LETFRETVFVLVFPDLVLTLTVILQVPDFSPFTDVPVTRHVFFDDAEILIAIFEPLGTSIFAN